MKKLSLASILIIFLSLFLIKNTNTTPRYFEQNDFDSTENEAIFNSKRISIPLSLANIPTQVKVLGDSNVNKKIYVDLTNQMLYAYEDENLVFSFLISSGKWGKTPTGVFDIWSKFRFTKMSGGSTALKTYYYLPNVPYVMFFSNDKIAASRGFSIHGTYWHDNFGHPMSHGCINMKTSEAGLIYNWTDPKIPEGKKTVKSSPKKPGTQIIIYGKAPSS